MHATDWLYCRVVNRHNVHFPRMPFWLGQTEFSALPETDESIANALATSLRAYSLAAEGSVLVRARALVLHEIEDDAHLEGALHVTEAVRAYSAHVMPVRPIQVLEAGYLRNLKSQEVVPLMPRTRRIPRIGAAFVLDNVAHHPLHTLNTLLATPSAFGDLGSAFRRSSHWRELAENALDEGEMLLLHWMAAECLAKTKRDEDIVPRLLASVGFPVGLASRQLDRALATRLVALPTYREWRRQLKSLLIALRFARNHIVHSGYRATDLSLVLTPEQRRLGKVLLPKLSQLVADFALTALNHRILSVDEMWLRYAELMNSELENLALWMIDRVSEKATRPGV